MSKSKKASSGKSGKAAMGKKSRPGAVNKPAAKKLPARKPVAAATKKSAKAKPKPAKPLKPAKKALPAKAKPKPKPAPAAKKPIAKKAVPKPAKKPVAKAVTKKSAPAKKAAVKPVATKKVAVNAPKKEVAKRPEPQKELKEKAPARPVALPKAPEEKPKKAEEPTKKQLAEKRSADVLAITNTIPVAEKPVISASRIASISHSITNPIKRPDSYSVRVEKEPPGKFEMEFVVHASAEMLYEFLSTPSGLSEWFCDDLNIRNGIYTFIWEDTMQQARLLKTLELQLVRFQWVDKTDGSYFEFRIQRDDLTNDISLIITDFAESNGDRESSKLLWHSQIEKLMHVIGSIF